MLQHFQGFQHGRILTRLRIEPARGAGKRRSRREPPYQGSGRSPSKIAERLAALLVASHADKLVDLEIPTPTNDALSMGVRESANFISVDEYIAGEQLSEIRHEYIGGQVYAMAGGSEAHNTICLNLALALRAHLRGKRCKVFMTDMKLRLEIAGDDVFYYPDLLVVCDPSDDAKYFKTKPDVLVEVLSPSTERLDRREKFFSYQQLPSLQEYILVDQERMHLTLFRKSSSWKPEHLTAADTLQIASVGFELPVPAIYEDVLPSP